MKVVIAIINDEQNRFLISQRPFHVPHGGYWEFPGGKIEVGESAEAALVREIKEELGLEIIQARLLGEIHHLESPIQFSVFQVSEFIGNPRCLEGQLALKWLAQADLNPAQFPKANQAIFNLLKLPHIA